MAEVYLRKLIAVMKATTPEDMTVKLECKHFFSGAAVYADGKICMSLTPVGFAIKLPKESRTMLLKERGAQPLRYFPQGPIKKEYVVLPKAMLNDTTALRRWVNVSITYVRSLPGLRKNRS